MVPLSLEGFDDSGPPSSPELFAPRLAPNWSDSRPASAALAASLAGILKVALIRIHRRLCSRYRLALSWIIRACQRGQRRATLRR